MNRPDSRLNMTNRELIDQRRRDFCLTDIFTFIKMEP